MEFGNGDALEALEELGFTKLEARIYIDLLRNGSLTGYRIAQHVGKAAANTYKALEALERRGMVVSEDSGARSYRATAYPEAVAMLSKEFSRRAQAANEALSLLESQAADDRVYRLQRDEAIYERARSAIESAKSIVVIDAFPAAINTLRDSLEAATSRGLQVIARVYAQVDLSSVDVVLAPDAEGVLHRWPGTWLNVSCDGDAALIAHLDGERTTGTWTQNPYVSWILYCGMASETAMASMRAILVHDPECSLATALELVRPMLPIDPPGRTALYSRLLQKGKPS